MTQRREACTVGLHRITWRATGSALSNTDAIADAMAWLIGDEEDVQLDQSTSYHGPVLMLVEAKTSKKRKALSSLARLGSDALNTVLETLPERLDEDHVVHFRLVLDNLVNGEIVLAKGSGTGHVKGQAKFEVYPGKPALEQITETIQQAIGLAHAEE
ncbi:MAG: RNA-binding domain-containing protein [Poseidonia sp.]|jgi:RNA binding exosome subunit